jgi:formylglycine-generating enzyme required for sulfatase activity
LKKILLALSIVGLFGGGWIAFYFYRADQAEQLHARLEETEIEITNVAHANLHLLRAGKDLQNIHEFPVMGDRFWLRKGNYFVAAEQKNKHFYFPITVLGYANGPDEGKLGLTIRGYPSEFPGKGFVYIPAGYFLMGDRLNPQEPQFVWLGSYFIGIHEVTNYEFRQFINDPDGYRRGQNWNDAGKKWMKANASRCSALIHVGEQDFERFGRDDQPVSQVKWYESNAYAKWLTRKKGSGKFVFSLPSEAEWEKAARGPDSFDYGLGNAISDAESHLYNWKKNPDAPVAVVATNSSDYMPNRYGVYHMSGNVSEWTQSEFLPFSQNHPYDEFERNRDDSPDQRVVRGGSWYCASIALLSLPYRDAFQAETSTAERGFRIVARRLPG